MDKLHKVLSGKIDGDVMVDLEGPEVTTFDDPEDAACFQADMQSFSQLACGLYIEARGCCR